METLDPFLAEAKALLGARGLTGDAELIAPWLSDWRGRYHSKACALASPANTAEVAALVELCRNHRVPIVPQGGNSGMSGGATPDASGQALLLSLRRMNTVRGFDPASGTITCEAGMVLETLHNTAAGQGLRFPLTLGGKGSATVGGLISTNAGGTQVLRHGVMRALVLGIEAVLPDGTVYSALTPLKKDNRGFDLKQLFIGSEGTPGIVTAATLRLAPAVRDRPVHWAGVPSLHAARALLLECEKRAGLQLEGFEVMPAACLNAVLDYLPDGRAPLSGRHAWHALIEFVSSGEDGAPLQDLAEAALGAAMAAGQVEDAVLAASESQAEAFWLLRDSAAPAERVKGPAMQHDISVPVEAMPDFVAAAVPEIEAAWPGTEAIAFGHLGDGNVHFHVLAPPGAERGAWEESEGKAISRQVHDLVTRWGGSIPAEHGIGQMKRGELAGLGDPVPLELMRAIKRALDPDELLNPGKLVALAPSAPSA